MCVHAQWCPLFVTPWTIAHQAPLSMECSREGIQGQLAISYSRGSSQTRDQTHILLHFLHWQADTLTTRPTWEAQGRKGGEINWKIGIDIYTQSCVKQVSNKNLPQSVGDSTQYFAITCMRIDSLKKCMCIYTYTHTHICECVLLFTLLYSRNQLYINYTPIKLILKIKIYIKTIKSLNVHEAIHSILATGK